MRHIKFLTIFVLFCVLPSFLLKGAVEVYFSHVEKEKLRELFTIQEEYIRKLKNDIVLKTYKNTIISDIEKRLLGKEITPKLLKKIQDEFDNNTPNLLKLYYFDDKNRLINRKGVKYRFIFEQFVKALNKSCNDDSYRPSEVKLKLFKKIMGDWQKFERIAFKKGDFSDIVFNLRRSDIYWDNLSSHTKSGTLVVIIDKLKYESYYSVNAILKNWQEKFPLNNIEFGKLSSKTGELKEFLKKNFTNIHVDSILYLTTFENERYIFSLMPINDLEDNVIYARSSKLKAYPEKERFQKILNVFIQGFILLFFIISFLISYGYLNIFISARIKLISIFLLSSILPLSITYYFSFLYLQYRYDTILDEKYKSISQKVHGIDRNAYSYKKSLLHLAISVKNLDETKKLNIDSLKSILEPYRERGDLHSYNIFDRFGKLILSSSSVLNDKTNVGYKLSRAIANAVIDFYNGKKGSYHSGPTKASDTIQSVLSNIIFDPKTGTLSAIFKEWGKIHTMDFMGKKYNFYVDIIADDKEKANGVLVFYFNLDNIFGKILRNSITSNNKKGLIKLFTVSSNNISLINQFPEPFSPELINFTHKVINEGGEQRGIINYHGQKMLIDGTILKEIPGQIVIGPLPYFEVASAYNQTVNLIIRIFFVTMLVLIFISIIISRKFLTPIRILQAGVEEIGKNNLDYRIDIDSNDEFGNLSKTFNNMTSSLKETMLQLELSNENLRLTNLTLDKRLRELQVLYDISQNLRFISEIDDLIDLILERVNKTLNAHHCSVLLLTEDKSALELKMMKGITLPTGITIRLKPDEGIIGYALKTGEVVLVNDVANDERFKNIEGETKIHSLLCAPLILSGQPIGVINVVDKQEENKQFLEEDKNLLKSIASQLSITIENFYLQKELMEKERMAKELEIAHDIQKSLFPSERPQLKNFSVDFNNIPAKECGGDYYDFIELSEELTGFAIADVSGKGVPAALIMVMARTILRGEASAKLKPDELIGRLNNRLSDTIVHGRFITFFYGILESSSGLFTFSNGGHNYPYLYRASSGKIEELELDGMLLGVMTNNEYESLEIKLELGDILVMYTDGVTEAQNSNQELFGEDRLKEIIIENSQKSANEIRKNIEIEVFKHTGSAPQFDDITLIVIKREA